MLVATHSIEEFMVLFCEICERYVKSFQSSQQKKLELFPTCDYYSLILQELDEIGSSYVKQGNETLTLITFEVEDGRKRKHELTVRLKNYPKESPLVSFQLPLAQKALPLVASEWLGGSFDLPSIFAKFSELVQKFQLFWDVCDDFDANSWILGDVNRSSVERRINLGNHSCMVVSVSPQNPFKAPQIRFVGAENARVSENANYAWSEDCFPRINLENMFHIKFPLVPVAEKIDEESCCICYSLLDAKMVAILFHSCSIRKSQKSNAQMLVVANYFTKSVCILGFNRFLLLDMYLPFLPYLDHALIVELQSNVPIIANHSFL